MGGRDSHYDQHHHHQQQQLNRRILLLGTAARLMDGVSGQI